MAADTSHIPDRLLLSFETNSAADGQTEACIFLNATDVDTDDKTDFHPSAKCQAAACEQFLIDRRKMLRPGDASSFDKWPDQSFGCGPTQRSTSRADRSDVVTVYMSITKAATA